MLKKVLLSVVATAFVAALALPVQFAPAEAGGDRGFPRRPAAGHKTKNTCDRGHDPTRRTLA